ncbi:MAG TPA: class I adenylate-forming enzyme family protein [Pseudonocardia sp.]|nr:class I adenylate-forming enzyme family protein [Pseudonocardia sp.]
MNVLTSLERAALHRPDELAVRKDGVALTYRELFDTAARFAGHLVREGLRPGERVGIYLHNELAWLPALLGIWRAGGVAVPFNYLFAPAALRHAAADSGARWVLALATDVPRLRDTLQGTEAGDRIVSIGAAGGSGVTGGVAGAAGDAAGAGGGAVPGAVCSFKEAVAGAPLERTVPRMDGDDALLMYTSGSTGRPKGVRQTHRNTTAACEAVIDTWRFGPADHALICTPLFHVGGLQLMALPLLLAGGSATLRRWQPREWLDDVLALRPSYVALVPAMLIDIVNLLGERETVLDSVRVCAVGGSAMPAARLGQFTALTGIVPVNIYGQTEQSGLSVTEPINADRRPGSLGRPLDQVVQWQLVPAGATEPLPPRCGDVGELWVRGDAVTPGYWRLPEVNAAKFTAEGWLRTGDLVREQADGYLYYLERTDDMIISGGENVYPQTVEGHLQECPLIAEVTVIGTAHERLVEQVTAIVVPSAPDVTAEHIAAFCQSRPDLRGLQRPRRIELVDEIPRTATNKVDRPALRRRFP